MTHPRNDADAERNDRLVEQNIEIARMAGSLAHEIKNPLSVIRMNMDLLAEDLAEGDSPHDRRALKKVGVVQSQCIRLQTLLDDFLSFARAERLQLRPASLNAQITDVLDFVAPQMAESGIEVARHLAADLPHVMLDRNKLHGALLNLVLNAQQAMPDGGQLWIRTRETTNSVALDMIDTGCGMDNDTLLHIFDVFYSTKQGGSGLGLPTTRRIIEAHQGTISVLSKVGNGTQFTIEFPIATRLEA